MTPKQIKESSTKDLLIVLKNKARCFYCTHKANAIFREIERRLDKDILIDLRISISHMAFGEGDREFNEECDKIIKRL